MGREDWDGVFLNPRGLAGGGGVFEGEEELEVEGDGVDESEGDMEGEEEGEEEGDCEAESEWEVDGIERGCDRWDGASTTRELMRIYNVAARKPTIHVK